MATNDGRPDNRKPTTSSWFPYVLGQVHLTPPIAQAPTPWYSAQAWDDPGDDPEGQVQRPIQNGGAGDPFATFQKSRSGRPMKLELFPFTISYVSFFSKVSRIRPERAFMRALPLSSAARPQVHTLMVIQAFGRFEEGNVKGAVLISSSPVLQAFFFLPQLPGILYVVKFGVPFVPAPWCAIMQCTKKCKSYLWNPKNLGTSLYLNGFVGQKEYFQIWWFIIIFPGGIAVVVHTPRSVIPLPKNIHTSWPNMYILCYVHVYIYI